MRRLIFPVLIPLFIIVYVQWNASFVEKLEWAKVNVTCEGLITPKASYEFNGKSYTVPGGGKGGICSQPRRSYPKTGWVAEEDPRILRSFNPTSSTTRFFDTAFTVGAVLFIFLWLAYLTFSNPRDEEELASHKTKGWRSSTLWTFHRAFSTLQVKKKSSSWKTKGGRGSKRRRRQNP